MRVQFLAFVAAMSTFAAPCGRAADVRLGRETTLRLYQRVLIPNRTAGNALWRNLRIE